MPHKRIQPWYRKENDTGFTLIELLVAVAVSSIILLAIGQFFISTNRSNTVLEKVSSTQQGIRAAMEMMSRDIRMAGFDPERSADDAGFSDSNDGTGDNSIAIAYDDDGDGECNDDREYVCYSFDQSNGRIIYRWSNDGGANWPSNQSYSITEDNTIDDMSFEYFEDKDALDNNNPISDLSSNLDDIRFVKVTVCGTITGAYSDDLNSQLCFTNVVRSRNM